MADKRKLQGEIDRCIKKVAEGVALFEDVWQKVQTAPSLNQKEKFEADLKKEIKKLQRLRDQIKTWLASNDIKDKRQLTENRKIIEAQMERFKVVERETKTKAYSKEGLGAATKVDPKEKEKEEAKEWVTTCIDSLQLQKDQFESEIEGIDNKKKGNRIEKDRLERLDELKKLLEQHQEHIDCLELVLRGVDNDQIDLEQLKQIKESVEYYVEPPHDGGDLSIYDDLNLDALRLSSNAVGLTALANDDDSLSNSSDPPLINPSSPSPGITNHSKDKPHEEEKKHGSKSASHADDKGSQHSSKASTAGLQLNCVSIPITPTKRDSISSSLESTTPDAILRTPPPVAYAQAVSGNQQNSRTNSTSSQPSSGSAGNSRPASQSAWTAAEGKSSEHGSSSTVPVTPTTVIAGAPPAASAPPPSNGASTIVNGVVNGSSDLPPTAPTSSLTGASSALPPSQPTAGLLLPGDTSSAVVSPPLSAAFPGHSTSSLFPTQSASDSKVVLNGSSSAIASLGKLQGHSDLSSLSAKLLTASQQQQQQDLTAPASLSALAGTVFDSLPPNSLSSSNLSLLMQQQGQGQGSQLQSYMLHQQGQGLQQQAGQGSAGSQQQQIPLQTTTIHLSPLLGVAPLGTQPLTKEQLYQMALLDTASMHLPYPSDSERLRYYLPRNPCPAPPYYPQSAPTQSDAVEFYQKLSVETLFFIFYYMEGTKAQYLAAKALKKQSWRFHTKYMMWFQRHEEPKMITEDYEQGTYVYFDYEKWCQRKKEGFTFEYRFLEDRDLN